LDRIPIESFPCRIVGGKEVSNGKPPCRWLLTEVGWVSPKAG